MRHGPGWNVRAGRLSMMERQPMASRKKSQQRKSSSKGATRRRRADGPTLAQQADRYALYLASVQEPSFEVRFFRTAYRQVFGRDTEPRVLREDFCGTAAVCYEWVKGHPKRRAIGVDLDPEPLQWGRQHLAARLRQTTRDRVTLLEDDCLRVIQTKADIVAAENFSYWLFKTRAALRDYFKAAHANLGPRGLLIVDSMGGPESMTEQWTDQRPITGPNGRFKYLWEQQRINPIDHHCRFHIHFEFRDKSRLERAFSYDWRFWTIPEVRELMLEAGFEQSLVFWEKEDKDGEGTGRYRIQESAPNDPSWICYIAGVKGR